MFTKKLTIFSSLLYYNTSVLLHKDPPSCHLRYACDKLIDVGKYGKKGGS